MPLNMILKNIGLNPCLKLTLKGLFLKCMFKDMYEPMFKPWCCKTRFEILV